MDSFSILDAIYLSFSHFSKTLCGQWILNVAFVWGSYCARFCTAVDICWNTVDKILSTVPQISNSHQVAITLPSAR